MKKLLILLFSIFLLISPPVFADDISDFEIEGISIGDSLLDYMTEDEILEEIELRKDYYYYLKEPNKYAEVYLFKDFPTYNSVAFFIKDNSTNKFLTNKNEQYTILSVRGLIYYYEDFDSCIQKRDEIVKVLSKMFPDVQKTVDIHAHAIDPSGDSIINIIFYKFDSGAQIDANCIDFEETLRIKNNWSEGLGIFVISKEIHEWFQNY